MLTTNVQQALYKQNNKSVRLTLAMTEILGFELRQKQKIKTEVRKQEETKI